MKTTEKSTQNPFTSEQSKKNYNDFFNAAKQNYTDVKGYTPQMFNSINGLNNRLSTIQKNGNVGDTSYFKQGWNGAMGIDQSNLNKMNTQSWNPNDNEDWVKANDAIDNNARLGWGQYNNQLMQNMIGSNMANGSGHQTAAAKQSMMLNSQLAADRANRWQQQYNQNMQSNLAANNQLGNFYNTLSNIGIDYARLNQQDLATLLNAYQTQSGLYNNIFNGQNDALKTYGNAVLMGSDPTRTSEGTQKGTKTTEGTQGKSDGSWGGVLGNAVGFATGRGWL